MHYFLYGLLTGVLAATALIIVAQSKFNYTLNWAFIVGKLKGLFYKTESSIKKDINKL